MLEEERHAPSLDYENFFRPLPKFTCVCVCVCVGGEISVAPEISCASEEKKLPRGCVTGAINSLRVIFPREGIHHVSPVRANCSWRPLLAQFPDCRCNRRWCLRYRPWLILVIAPATWFSDVVGKRRPVINTLPVASALVISRNESARESRPSIWILASALRSKATGAARDKLTVT